MELLRLIGRPIGVGLHLTGTLAPFQIDESEAVRVAVRSEEHTSELHSRRNLVCRLLLEKKKIGRAHV